MTATAKTVSALAIAMLLSLALFLSPVGISSAQDGEDDATTEQIEPDGRPGPRGDLTDEEREALRAEREAERQAFLDDAASELGVTSDELVDAFKTAAINRVEEKLAAGDITQEQADTIIERIEEDEGLPGFGRGGPGGRGGHHHGPRGGGAGPGAGGDVGGDGI